MDSNTLRPVLRSPLAQALRGPFDMGLLTRFSPASLFAAGEQGAWYDPSDMSTLFQDAAGTIPVTATGQPVGRMLDKSGRGNHATQATATARPTYTEAGGRRFLAFDGVDDFMVTGAIDFSATDKMSVFAGLRKLSDASQGILAELSASVLTNDGAFSLQSPNAAAPNIQFISKGTVSQAATNTAAAAPVSSVTTGAADISAPSLIIRANGAVLSTNMNSQGTGNYGNHPLYLGSRGGVSARFNGNLYGLIVRGATSIPSQISSAEMYLASKTGVVIP